LKEVFLLQNRQLRKHFLKILNENHIEDNAKLSKFKIRNSGKITPNDFLWLSCFSGHNLCTSSLEELCASLFLNKDIEVSPQALDQRINKTSTEFLKSMFLTLCKNQSKHNHKAFKNWGFPKIFLMDSSEIRLPDKLKGHYKGFYKSNPSVLKINLLIELMNYSIENTVLTDATVNEHNFSNHIYDKLVLDSLVLKDLGYFKFDDFDEIESKNSFFISRLKAGTRLFTPNPNPEFNRNGKVLKKTKYLVTNAGELGKELEVGETKEFEFLVGSGEKKSLQRIILTKLGEDLYQKRLKDIEERERKGKHCAKLSRDSVGVSGYITNLHGIIPLDIIEIYRLRWQIELLFKIFKSDFNLDKLKDLKVERIETHIYATLIRILLLMEITKGIKGGFSEEVSIRRVLKSSLGGLNNFLETLKNEESFIRLFSKLEKIIDSKRKKVPSK